MDAVSSAGKGRRPGKRRWLIALIIVAILIPAIVWYNGTRKYVHTHCIKQSGFYLLEFADTNHGRFPESERGFGDALLKLSDLDESHGWIPFFTNGRDQGEYFRQALASGGDVDESLCSRTYVQGLHEDSHPGIAILFDTESIRGGDHLFMSPGQAKLRELIRLDNSMEKVTDAQWPAFVETQRELLSQEGFSEAEINRIYPRS